MFKNFFASSKGIIITGAIIGVIAITLQKLGNPQNMGVCVACFVRDITGSLGLHRAGVVQYMRPEIFGIILGAFISAFFTGDFKPRSTNIPVIKFILGAFAMIGALVFLGCPWRALLRIAGGDLNGLIGLAGLILGIFIGTRFFAIGYNPGKASPTFKSAGLVMPVISIALLILMFFFNAKTEGGILFYSTTGPGAKHAPILISLGAGLIVGFLLQRSRLCTIGGFRDLILFKQTHLFWGLTSLVIAGIVMNLIFGTFKVGMEGQPIAHSMIVWNFLGMVLAGLAFSLAGGCPGRQLVMAGEGSGDSSVFLFGMVAGAAFAHNFGLAATPKGVGINGMVATIIGISVCIVIGLTLRDKKS